MIKINVTDDNKYKKNKIIILWYQVTLFWQAVQKLI